MRVAVDTWALRESLIRTPRALEVQGLIAEADAPFTVRECIVETFNHLQRRYGRAEQAWQWWNAVRSTPLRVYEPPLEEIHAFIAKHDPTLPLSLADWSLACVAKRERTRTILTEDAAFRDLDLEPLFAR